MRGGLVLGLEDTGSRMSRIGKAELVHGELLPVDEMLDRIDAVTLDDVREVADRTARHRADPGGHRPVRRGPRLSSQRRVA